jgi:hypothetical protein
LEIMMSRRLSVAVCLVLGLLVTPGVALADPPWWGPDAPAGWGDPGRGDVCDDRGDPPCHGTTTNHTSATTTTVTTTTRTTTPSTGGTSTGTSTGATTTTTDVSGTSATSATTTTTDVSGTSATSTSGTTATATTTATTTGTVPLQTTAPGAPPVVRAVSSSNHALAGTGAAPLWTVIGGLAVLIGGAVLLLFGRRRRA